MIAVVCRHLHPFVAPRFRIYPHAPHCTTAAPFFDRCLLVCKTLHMKRRNFYRPCSHCRLAVPLEYPTLHSFLPSILKSASTPVFHPYTHVFIQAFLDYVTVRTRMPALRSELSNARVPDAAQALELEELSRSIPKLIGILPDVLRDRSDPRHNVALSEMISRLTAELDAVQPLALVSATFPTFHTCQVVRRSCYCHTAEPNSPPYNALYFAGGTRTNHLPLAVPVADPADVD